MQQPDFNNIPNVTPRTFSWMPRLDGYVFREFLVPYTTLLFAFTLLFLIADVFNDLSDFLDEKATREAIRYFTLKIPGNIRFILPITVLLSSMYTLANFGRHREITAMRASGISLFRCSRPILIMAFLTMCVNFWFNEQLVPQCNNEASIIFASLGNPEYEKNLNSKLQYQSGDKKRSWYFGHFDEDGVQSNIKLKFFEIDDADSTHKNLVKMIEAKTARYIPGKGWAFTGAKITFYGKQNVKNDITDDKKGLAYEKLVPTVDPYIVPLNRIPDRPDMIEKAVILPENLSSVDIFMILRGNKFMAKSLRNIYETIFYYRIAFPWICFLCAFLTLPLASKNERAGIFTAIAMAVGMIVAYQILTEIAMIAGKYGYMPPILAGLGPTIIFAVYGIWLARKAG